MRKLKRFVKGSKEARRFMARLRAMRKGGRLKKRKGTYRNGVIKRKGSRKGKIPPQLKPYLFKKKHRSLKQKRRTHASKRRVSRQTKLFIFR